jgi:hypothetical protein
MQEQVHNELWDRDERISINRIEVNPDKVFKIQEGIEVKGQKIPDPKLHQRISFLKSAIRLGACAFGFFGMFEVGFIGLFLAEIVGIGEELV